jgi:hypothetical protein
MIRAWSNEPAKMWLGFMVLISAHHFLNYARQVTDQLEQECRALEVTDDQLPALKSAEAV